jgi:hypothetical protein
MVVSELEQLWLVKDLAAVDWYDEVLLDRLGCCRRRVPFSLLIFGWVETLAEFEAGGGVGEF